MDAVDRSTEPSLNDDCRIGDQGPRFNAMKRYQGF
jgi:hypothetical protein